MLGTNIFVPVHPEDRPAVIAEFQRGMAAEGQANPCIDIKAEKVSTVGSKARDVCFVRLWENDEVWWFHVISRNENNPKMRWRRLSESMWCRALQIF